ncbi:MAG: hypothetical protein ACTSQP_18430 [Promethearchaeota archaeon]
MRCLKIKDMQEMLEQNSKPDNLPSDIEYQKYNEIFDQLKLPNTMF